jgi:hypothetical protein
MTLAITTPNIATSDCPSNHYHKAMMTKQQQPQQQSAGAHDIANNGLNHDENPCNANSETMDKLHNGP